MALLLESFRKRKVSWTTMQTIFNFCQLPKSLGWDTTIPKLIKLHSEEDKYCSNFLKLDTLYRDNLYFAEKSVLIFETNKSYNSVLTNALTKYEIKETIFHEHYPFILPEDKLNEVDLVPQMVNILNTEQNLTVTFCTRRSFKEEVEIDSNNLKPEFKDKNHYDKIIGIQKHIYQFFDMVVIWKDREFIEIRLDISYNISQKERNVALVKIIESFNLLAKEILGVETVLHRYVNFFPLINKLYHSKEGKISDLSFVTDEGSIKSEKMRKNTGDLREETYHKAGKQAVNHITPFQISIIWEYEISEEIEKQIQLTIPGKYYYLNIPNPSLTEIFIKQCIIESEYNLILNKISKYLNINLC